MGALRTAAVSLACALSCAGCLAQATAPAPLAGNLPLRRETASPAPGGAWSTPALLAGLTGAAGAWAWWRRAARKRTSAGRDADKTTVHRLSSQALTQQASVHAVRWNGEEFLLGCTAHQVTLISRRPVDSEEAP